jgi:hypothetical protein
MYTDVSVQRLASGTLSTLDGHAYDISEAGMRIELDEVLDVGERVSACVRLPGETNGIFVSGRVVWINDDEEDPGARRMAIRFTRFLSPFDHTRLVWNLGSGAHRTAA